MSPPNLSNLTQCTADCLKASQSPDPGPAPPQSFDDMMRRLTKSRAKLPPLYRRSIADPLIATLLPLGEEGFARLLARDGDALDLVLDFAQAVIQKGENYRPKATDAFQEVVSDLYDGFLSAEDRRGVKPPDEGVIPPLVKWGNPADGPYTMMIEPASEILGVDATIVNLPPEMARQGLLAWACLGHETAGHDILGADHGLPEELARAVHDALRKAKAPAGLPHYWSRCIEETASDVMGILNMGPAAAIGLLVFLRGFRGDGRGPGKLTTSWDADDDYAPDVLRGFLGASVVRRLQFSDAAAWASAIETDAAKGVAGITMNGQPVKLDVAKRSADVVAKAIMETHLESLERHALSEIQNWHDADEAKVAELMTRFAAAAPMPLKYPADVYAAHVVAAAVYTALGKVGGVSKTFGKMLVALQVMHDTNPAWGPLYVVHRGDVRRSFVLGRSGARRRRLASAAAARGAKTKRP